ncbi:MAG TPA: preprotein translocase subunit YajC [Hellea balneolensis]|uniref:Sec translocon accessory complex subunit YajC n=1 Tax=Hellea balneolensis TaxID=287478 RepID=A0A7C5R171_9PROT|nr:preprotein translocase subunit YajC [Hellea balneolensis]
MLMSIMPFVLIGLVFYFLLIRPQNQRLKEHKAMLASVTRGDTVVTNGGLIGKVTKVADGELTLDLGGGNKVKVVSTMLADVRNKTAPANDTAKK